MISDKIDIAGSLRKPYKGRRISLFQFVDGLVEERNTFVHKGMMVRHVTDEEIKRIIDDMETAGNRIYDMFGTVYNLTLLKDF